MHQGDDTMLLGKNKNNRLLEWQNLLVDTPTNKLLMNEKKLKAISVLRGNREIEILNDCAQLINTTTNIDTFFSRYDIYIEKITFLSQLEKFVHIEGESPSTKMKEITQEYQQTLINFINRYWNSVLQKATSLKTVKGKQNQYKKFEESFKAYSNKIPENVKIYISMLVGEQNKLPSV